MLKNAYLNNFSVETIVEKYGEFSRRTLKIYNYLGFLLLISLTINNAKKYINSHEMNIIQVLLHAFIRKENKKYAINARDNVNINISITGISGLLFIFLYIMSAVCATNIATKKQTQETSHILGTVNEIIRYKIEVIINVTNGIQHLVRVKLLFFLDILTKTLSIIIPATIPPITKVSQVYVQPTVNDNIK